MGLFGSPSEELIRSFWDRLQVVSSDEGLTIRPGQLQRYSFKLSRYAFHASIQEVKSSSLCLTTDAYYFRSEWYELPVRAEEVNPADIPISSNVCEFKSEWYELGARTHAAGSSTFSISANTEKPDYSFTCFREQVDHSIACNASSDADFRLPPLRIRRGKLLSSDDARSLTHGEFFESLKAWGRTVDLIFASDIQASSVNLTRFNAVIERFSFPSVQNRHGTSRDRQSTGARIHVARVGEVAAPSRPPSLNQSNLKERLKWLLTPPIHEILSDPDLALPEKPFPYQTYGIKWLYDRENGLLADEMGLGKTMQAIIAARLLWRDGSIKQVLIVCPKSLIANWQKELQHWWTGIEYYTKLVGQDRHWFLRLATKEATIKIINYEMLTRESDWLKDNRPPHDLVIIDEAQRIKNPKSKTAQAVKSLNATRRWALTGTPLENSLGDLVSIMGFVRPGLINDADSEARIRESIKPYMLRRRQEEVQIDLPAMVSQDIEIDLGAEQRAAYDLAEQEGIVELNEKGESITITHVFALINRLRQICNFHPISGVSAKAELVLEELEEIMESGRKALIFGYFVKEPYGLKRLAKVISESKAFKTQRPPLELHGDIPQKQRDAVIERFQKSSDYQLLLANYAVGGVGLNLQAANYVFLFDRWWNPALEDQAIKRSHRIGQRRTVFAKRLYCRETIEERIIKKLAEKRRIFANVIEGIDDKPPEESFGLSEDEIFSLFNLKVRPRRTSPSVSLPRIVLDDLEPDEFKDMVVLLYEKEGFTLHRSEKVGDVHVLVLVEQAEKAGLRRIVVQCRHRQKHVDRSDLEQFWDDVQRGRTIIRCDVVASGGFTVKATEFASGKKLKLVDMGMLTKLTKKLGVAEIVGGI
jgi:superfamily II DNA or RNA helicase